MLRRAPIACSLRASPKRSAAACRNTCSVIRKRPATSRFRRSIKTSSIGTIAFWRLNGRQLGAHRQTIPKVNREKQFLMLLADSLIQFLPPLTPLALLGLLAAMAALAERVGVTRQTIIALEAD